MADQLQAAATGTTGSQDQAGEEQGGVSWLDWAGGAAAVLLVIIVVDIFADGRLISAPLHRLFARRGQEGGGGDGVPPAGPGGN